MSNRRSTPGRQWLIKVPYNSHQHTTAHTYTGSDNTATSSQVTGGMLAVLPAPVLHQITLSWCSGKNLYDEFAKAFGLRRGNTFPNGLFIKKVKERPWYSVMFTADAELLTRIAKLRDEISPWHGAVQLKRVGVAWNIPYASYLIAKRIMLRLADNTMLKGYHARLWLERGDIMLIDDDTANGEVTAYFQPLRRRHDEFVLIKCPVWKLKMYLKQFSGIWHIHIEITLEKKILHDNGIPMYIPNSICPNWLEKIHIDRFFKFALFNMRDFIDAVHKLQGIRQYSSHKTVQNKNKLHIFRLGLRELEAAIDKPACDQKNIAFNIAALLKSERLKQRIMNGEFDHPYNPFVE